MNRCQFTTIIKCVIPYLVYNAKDVSSLLLTCRGAQNNFFQSLRFNCKYNYQYFHVNLARIQTANKNQLVHLHNYSKRMLRIYHAVYLKFNRSSFLKARIQHRYSNRFLEQISDTLVQQIDFSRVSHVITNVEHPPFINKLWTCNQQLVIDVSTRRMVYGVEKLLRTHVLYHGTVIEAQYGGACPIWQGHTKPSIRWSVLQNMFWFCKNTHTNQNMWQTQLYHHLLEIPNNMFTCEPRLLGKQCIPPGFDGRQHPACLITQHASYFMGDSGHCTHPNTVFLCRAMASNTFCSRWGDDLMGNILICGMHNPVSVIRYCNVLHNNKQFDPNRPLCLSNNYSIFPHTIAGLIVQGMLESFISILPLHLLIIGLFASGLEEANNRIVPVNRIIQHLLLLGADSSRHCKMQQTINLLSNQHITALNFLDLAHSQLQKMSASSNIDFNISNTKKLLCVSL